MDGVRRVAQGESLLDTVATEALLERLWLASQGEPVTTPLRAQERQVLDLVARGCTDPQISAALSLSAEAVEQLVSNIFVKLGPRGRTASLLVAGRRGLPSSGRPDGLSV